MKQFLCILVLISILLFSCKRELQKELIEETIEKTERKLPERIKKIFIKSSPKISENSLRPYSRAAINKEFNIVKMQLHNEAKLRGLNSNLKCAISIDAYTGKKLLGGTGYEYDHVRSAEYVFNKYKAFLTDNEIAKVVNCRENIVATQRGINRAKGKWALEKLLNDVEKSRNLGINVTLSKQVANNADDGIKAKVQEIIKMK